MHFSTKLFIFFILGVVSTLLTFVYALGREGIVSLRGLPIPYIIDGSLAGANFLGDVIIWGLVWFSLFRLFAEFGRNIRDAVLIYGIIIFIVLILSLTFLISNRYQVIIRPPS